MTTLVSTAPTDGAAYSQPYPLAPTCRMSCAKIGSSAVADEKNVAKKSSSIVERMIGDENTKPKPSRTARTLMSLVSVGAARRHVAHHQERDDDADERQGVDGVDPSDAERGDDQAADRRTGHRRDLNHDGVQADRVGQMLARHQRRHQRLRAPGCRRRRPPRRWRRARRSARGDRSPRNVRTASATRRERHRRSA